MTKQLSFEHIHTETRSTQNVDGIHSYLLFLWNLMVRILSNSIQIWYIRELQCYSSTAFFQCRKVFLLFFPRNTTKRKQFPQTPYLIYQNLDRGVCSMLCIKRVKTTLDKQTHLHKYICCFAYLSIDLTVFSFTQSSVF